MRHTAVFALLAWVGLAPIAHADAYAGFTLGRMFFNGSDGLDLDYQALVARLGYGIGHVLSLELRAGTSSESADEYVNVTSRINYVAGGYVKLGIPMPWDPRLVVFGLAGYSETETELKIEGFGRGTLTTDSESYGGGLELYGSPNAAFTLEYMRYTHHEEPGFEADIDMLSAGVIWHF